MTEHYLGDGLYASMEGDVLKLRAPRLGGDNEVFLEPEVLAELLRYVGRGFIDRVLPSKDKTLLKEAREYVE